MCVWLINKKEKLAKKMGGKVGVGEKKDKKEIIGVQGESRAVGCVGVGGHCVY